MFNFMLFKLLSTGSSCVHEGIFSMENVFVLKQRLNIGINPITKPACSRAPLQLLAHEL
jgi:hypothetical protein